MKCKALGLLDDSICEAHLIRLSHLCNFAHDISLRRASLAVKAEVIIIIRGKSIYIIDLS